MYNIYIIYSTLPSTVQQYDSYDFTGLHSGQLIDFLSAFTTHKSCKIQLMNIHQGMK